MKIKMERVNSELARQISKIIAEDVKDPRLHNAINGVTKHYTTPDLKYAKVYLSIYANSDEERQEAYTPFAAQRRLFGTCSKTACRSGFCPN